MHTQRTLELIRERFVRDRMGRGELGSALQHAGLFAARQRATRGRYTY